MLGRAPTAVGPRDARLVLPRPGLLRALGRSHVQLVTDYYWLRALNRSLIIANADEGAALLALGELIADLDPAFVANYWMVGINAPFPPSGEQVEWPNAREAANLLRRGLSVAPTDNKLVVVLVATLMVNLHDRVGAARVLEERARYPGALPHFAPLATRLLAESGEFDASRELAQAMLDSAQDEPTRDMFRERLKLIDLEEILSAVDAAAKKYLAERGVPAVTTRDLVEAGYLPAEPYDPFGGVIVLKSGRAFSTAVEKRLEVHDFDRH